MPSTAYCRLSDLIQLSSLPTQFSLISGTFANALEKIYYKNLSIHHSSSDYIFSANLELVALRQLKLGIAIAPGSEFALVLNPEEYALSGLTTFPISLTSSLGIRKYYPLGYNFNFPILPIEFYEILLKVTGRQESEVVTDFSNAFINDSDPSVAPSRLELLATNLNSHFGQSNGLAISVLNADYTTALTQITNAFASTSPALSVIDALFDLYINESSIDDAIDNLSKLFSATLGKDPISFVSQLLIPKITASAHVSAGLQFPRSILAPVKANQDGTYSVESDINIKAIVLFAKAELSFNSTGGFGYDAQVAVSLPATHPRLQIGNTGIQISFTTAKLDLSSETNIAEAAADGRPRTFKGLYASQVDVFLPDDWTPEPGSVQLAATNLLVGTGGLSGKFGVKAGATSSLSNGALLQARLFQDIVVNFQSFDVTFSHSEVVSSNIKGTFTLETFLGTNGQPAPFAFELTYAADGYQLAFTAPLAPVTVWLGAFADVHFTKLILGKTGTNWYLDLAADIEVKQALPIIGKALPSKIAITRLRLDTSPAGVALTALPTWDDGTQVSIPPGGLADGFSLSRTLNLTILKALKVEQLRLSTHKDSDDTLQILATFDATLGLTSDSTAAAPASDNTPPPGFHARIANAGFTAALKPTPDGTGNLALADIHLGVKLPDSAGLSVNAGGLVGAGNLAILDNGDRYEGVLALAFRDTLQLTAYGILTRNLPGGGEGPSLLALITAQFSPIQLGLGFTLSGVGGLLGLHRSADTDYLRGLVRNGQLHQLLFPAPTTRSLASLTATLALIDAAFPATAGRYLIGIMAQLGWGAPTTLITLDVALLVELPAPMRVVILGVLHASLPSKTNEVLKLRADFLGEVDFGAKRVSFDATLSDSKLLAYTLTGDLAFRFYQGNAPLFVLTAGGFHPNFQPPAGAGLTRLRRLTLALAQDADLRVSLATYFALTSNTVQFGAHLTFYKRLRFGLHVEGHFGFDVLFHFNPFHVRAHFEAGVAIKRGGREVLSVHLALDVSGPGPWHLWGEATFRLLRMSYSIDVNATWGEQASTPPAVPAPQVRPLLVAALTDPASWQVVAPASAGAGGGVVLRASGVAPAGLFLAPRGTLVLRQRVAPLGVRLEQYGPHPVAPVGGHTFTLTAVYVGSTKYTSTGTTRLTPVPDFFAPAQFRRLSEAQKLSLPSFQSLPAGVQLTGLDALTSADTATRRVVAYEHVLVGARAASNRSDGASAVAAPGPESGPTLDPTFFGQLARNSALGRAYATQTESTRAPAPVNWAEDTYVLVHAADLTPSSPTRFASQVQAEDYRQGLAEAAELLVVPAYQLQLA